MVPATGLVAQVWPLDNLADAGSYFTEAATVDPLSAILLVLGNLLIVFSIGFFAYLTLGAAVDFVIPESPGRSPPPRE